MGAAARASRDWPAAAALQLRRRKCGATLWHARATAAQRHGFLLNSPVPPSSAAARRRQRRPLLRLPHPPPQRQDGKHARTRTSPSSQARALSHRYCTHAHLCNHAEPAVGAAGTAAAAGSCDGTGRAAGHLRLSCARQQHVAAACQMLQHGGRTLAVTAQRAGCMQCRSSEGEREQRVGSEVRPIASEASC